MGVNQSYAASEAMPLALPCRYGWLRLNSDWFLVEPIDPEGRTWYGRSLASRGKDSQCLSAYHPVVRRCSEVMVSAISCTKLDVEGGRRGRHLRFGAFWRWGWSLRGSGSGG